MPQSHLGGVHKRMVVEPGAGGVAFEGAYPEWDLSKFVPLEVAAGTRVQSLGSRIQDLGFRG
jgi:hypothetical protein